MQEKLLDEIDRKLIAMLRKNGRSKLVELSAEIGFTSMGVKKRLAKLIEKNVVSVSALLNHSLFKLQPASITVQLQRGCLKNLVGCFENCPKVVSLFTRRNNTQMAMMLVVGECRGALEGLLNSVKSQEGVLEAELQVFNEIYYSPYLAVRVDKMLGEEPPCGAECSSCIYYLENNCPGCPPSKAYRGPL